MRKFLIGLILIFGIAFALSVEEEEAEDAIETGKPYEKPRDAREDTDDEDETPCEAITSCARCIARSDCTYYAGQGVANPVCRKTGTYVPSATLAAVTEMLHCACFGITQFSGPYACQKHPKCQYCFEAFEMNDGDEEYPMCQPKLFNCSTQG